MSIMLSFSIFSKSKIDIPLQKHKELTITKKKSDDNWVSFLLKKDTRLNDRYPADEITLMWDLVSSSFKKETLYRLEVKNIDEYQYFCLLQVLKNKHIKKQIVKENDRYNIYLNLHNQSSAKLLLIELAAYNIDAKIEKFKSNIIYEGKR